MKKKVLKMDSRDNVATVLTDIKKGEKFFVISTEGDELEYLTAADTLKFGFKVSLTEIQEGDKIFKYGSEIGICYRHIGKAELVHIQNIKSNRISIPKNRIEEMVKEMGI